MKKYVLLSAVALFALPMLADTTHMSINSQGGDEAKYDLDKIVNITFDGNDMVVQHADGTDRHDMNNIEEIVFGTVSGIEEIRDFDLNEGLNVAIRRNMLIATHEGNELKLAIYDTNGRLIEVAEGNDELEYNLADLAKGTYILLVNGKALKFIR